MARHDVPAADDTRSELVELFELRFGHSLTEGGIDTVFSTMKTQANDCRFAGPREHLALLRTLPLDAPLLQGLLQSVTNNETYFFRDRTSMQSLRDQVLPPIIRNAAQSRLLRVWSAGCSTGEELYSVSILLREMITDIDFWSIELVGTDIDAAALARARKAEYKAWALRTTTAQERRRYFEGPHDNVFKLRTRYLRAADFQLHNLADPGAPIPMPGQFDLILCRNVAIYMHEAAQVVLRNKFTAALSSGGVWVSGPSDPVPSGRFRTRVLPGLLEHTPSESQRHQWDVRAQPSEAPARLSEEFPTWTPPTAESEEPVPATSFPPQPEPRSAPAIVDGDAALNAARALADRGMLDRALTAVDELIAARPLHADAYHLRALLHESSGQVDKALSDLKRLVYLEPAHAEGYLRLGLLSQRSGQHEAAVRAFRNAVVLADSSEWPGMSELRKVAAHQLVCELRRSASNG